MPALRHLEAKPEQLSFGGRVVQFIRSWLAAGSHARRIPSARVFLFTRSFLPDGCAQSILTLCLSIECLQLLKSLARIGIKRESRRLIKNRERPGRVSPEEVQVRKTLHRSFLAGIHLQHVQKGAFRIRISLPGDVSHPQQYGGSSVRAVLMSSRAIAIV